MSYNITHNKDDGGVITNYSGTVTDEELISSARERTTPIERVKSYKYLLSDFTGVHEFKVTPWGIRAAAEIANKMFHENSNILLSAVLPQDLQFGMGRMWQVYTEGGEYKSYLARTKEEAIQWLHQNLEN